MAARAGGAVVVVAMAVGMLAAMAMAQLEEEDAVVGLYQPRDPCPQVERIVESIVKPAVKRNPLLTGGFLRIFFHDCFTGGCDASVFLKDEWEEGVNRGSLQADVRDLVGSIRVEVNRQCGDRAVSCADILALATRDAVHAANGPRVTIFRGRFDSLKPITNLSFIPMPDEDVPSMLKKFKDFNNLGTAADLVALSGGHTVGKTKKACTAIRIPDLERKCRSNPRVGQDLDVLTPVVFDNKYFVGVRDGKGIFESDHALTQDAETKRLVETFARDQNAFFRQWNISFRKLSDVNWVPGNKGEIRRDCTRTNSGRLSNILDADQGFAGSA